jgi:hypothetical protein
MNVGAVMDQLGAALGTIPGLRVYPYTVDKVNVPAASVYFPDGITYDTTMRRGTDTAEFPVLIAVDRVNARAGRDKVSKWAAGDGEESVKAVIEAHETGEWDTVRVMRSEFGAVSIGGTDYLSVTFYIEIVGKGGS